MWFGDLMGFEEKSHDTVHNSIDLDGEYLISKVNGMKILFFKRLLNLIYWRW